MYLSMSHSAARRADWIAADMLSRPPALDEVPRRHADGGPPRLGGCARAEGEDGLSEDAQSRACHLPRAADVVGREGVEARGEDGAGGGAEVVLEPDAAEALGEAGDAVEGGVVGDGGGGVPGPRDVLPVDGDAGFGLGSGGLEREGEGVDGPFAADRGVGKGVALAGAEEGQ